MDHQSSTRRSLWQNRFQPLLKLQERSDPVINDRWPTRQRDTPASPDAKIKRQKRGLLTNKEENYKNRPNSLFQRFSSVMEKSHGGSVRSNLKKLSQQDRQETQPHAVLPSRWNPNRAADLPSRIRVGPVRVRKSQYPPHANVEDCIEEDEGIQVPSDLDLEINEFPQPLRSGEPKNRNGSRCSPLGGQDEIHDCNYRHMYLEPQTRPITQDELVNEVKGIYAGLVMAEKKCVEIDQQQSRTTNKLSDEQWQALIALHRTLLYEHHDFFLASHHPSASPALRRLARKYEIPAESWTNRIQSFLEQLDRHLENSLDHTLSSVPLAQSMIELLMEAEPPITASWEQHLGDLDRYRIAIEKFYVPDQGRWYERPNICYWKAKKVTQAEDERSPQLFAKCDSSIARRDGLFNSECSSSNMWGQGSLLRWKKSHGQGRSQTWRFCLYEKKTTKRRKASHRNERRMLECSWGPCSKLPISASDKQLRRILPRRTCNRPFNDLSIDLMSLIYFGDHIFSDDFSEELEINTSAEYISHASSQSFEFDGTILRFASDTTSRLPYENFIGAFLTPCYRTLRLIKSDKHGNIYSVEHLKRPQEMFYVKVYDIKSLLQDNYKYRIRNLKKLEKRQGHFETIYQRGRKLVVYRSEERSLAVQARTESSTETVIDQYELAFPKLVSPKVTMLASVKSGNILFSKIHLHQNGGGILRTGKVKAIKLKTPAQAKRKQMRQQRYRQNRKQASNRQVPDS